MTDIWQFRHDLHVLLFDLVGEYIFPNFRSPAISVWEPAYPPPGTKIQGLEVVVKINNQIGVTPLLSGSRQVIYEHQIILKQWDREENTIAAIERLLGFLPNTLRIGARLPATTALDNIETCTISFSESFIYGKPS